MAPKNLEFIARWDQFERDHCFPWLKSVGASSFSTRELERQLSAHGVVGVKQGTIAKWKRAGSAPNELKLQAIAEVVGAPDPVGKAAWLAVGARFAPGPDKPGGPSSHAGKTRRREDISSRTPSVGTRISALTPEEHAARIKAAAVLLAEEWNTGGLRDEIGMRAYLALQEFSRGRSSVGRAAAFYPGEWSSDFVTAGSEIGGTASGPFTSPSTPLTAIILIPHMLDAA